MNKMHCYDPEIYHPSLTHSIFVTLENSNLTFSYPQTSIPRRATFGEENFEVAFVTHQLYDMSGAKVRFINNVADRAVVMCSKYRLGIWWKGQESFHPFIPGLQIWFSLRSVGGI